MSQIDWLAVAEVHDVPTSIFRRRLRSGWTEERAATTKVQYHLPRYTGEFAVYRGEELLGMGTDKHCAELADTSVDYIRRLASRIGQERAKKHKAVYGLRVVKLDEEEEE